MTTSSEKTDLLAAFAEQRALLLITVRGLTDAQAGRRTTVSELTLGGIVKHLATGEEMWTRIMSERDGELPEGMLDTAQYRMAEDDTLPALLERYASAARATEEAVSALPDLDVSVPLPKTPWSPPEPEFRSARRILLHLIRETAQHAGHADLVRETLDGANTTAQR
ncbi:DinB family protein [Streptomyces massasporeus]|uniref:DinB family protein n=1 Tax=Streptomyces massasporeus TaxID=67324 RepID=UPI0033F56630